MMPSSTGATALEQLELKCLGQVSLVFNIELRNNLEYKSRSQVRLSKLSEGMFGVLLLSYRIRLQRVRTLKQWKVPLRGVRDGALCRFPYRHPSVSGYGLSPVLFFDM